MEIDQRHFLTNDLQLQASSKSPRDLATRQALRYLLPYAASCRAAGNRSRQGRTRFIPDGALQFGSTGDDWLLGSRRAHPRGMVPRCGGVRQTADIIYPNSHSVSRNGSNNTRRASTPRSSNRERPIFPMIICVSHRRRDLRYHSLADPDAVYCSAHDAAFAKNRARTRGTTHGMTHGMAHGMK